MLSNALIFPSPVKNGLSLTGKTIARKLSVLFAPDGSLTVQVTITFPKKLLNAVIFNIPFARGVAITFVLFVVQLYVNNVSSMSVTNILRLIASLYPSSGTVVPLRRLKLIKGASLVALTSKIAILLVQLLAAPELSQTVKLIE